LPVLEDANSVVLAVMEIQRALVDGLISEKTAGLLLYSVQIGAWVVRHATFAETEPEEMIRRLPESPRLAKVPKVKGKNPEPQRTQRNTEEEDDLSRIKADDSGPEEQLVNGNWQAAPKPEPQGAERAVEEKSAPAGDPPPHHAKRMSGTPVPAPHESSTPHPTTEEKESLSQVEMEPKIAPAGVPVPHELPGIHDLSAQAGAPALHDCSSSERRNPGLPEVATARGQEVIPGMNGVSPMISGMKEEG
jgi:hypothetical protein